MITIVLSEHTAEDMTLIKDARRLGMADEDIQKAYDRTISKRREENEAKILRQ